MFISRDFLGVVRGVGMVDGMDGWREVMGWMVVSRNLWGGGGESGGLNGVM